MKEINIQVLANEQKIYPFFWFGETSEEVTLKANLDQPGSSLKILGIFLSSKNLLTLKTEVVHTAPDTFSRTLLKGVLDGTGAIDFEGLVQIQKGAKNADADLKAHAILLSKEAKALAIPRLDVLENEVKAGHGATVGKIDEEQIFYVMSRGLSLRAAKDIIINGFLASLASEFPEPQRRQLSRKLKFSKSLKQL